MPGICGGFRGGNGSDWRWCNGVRGKQKEEEDEGEETSGKERLVGTTPLR
jgi:hypothetical protein